MARSGRNHPFVVWGACYLWFTSIIAILLSLVLFFCIGDLLIMTGMDLINGILLLSGVVMMPTNVYILWAISNGRTMDYRCQVLYCPLWLCTLWIILINLLGAILCARNLLVCDKQTERQMNYTLRHYRSVPKCKHMIDNLQWSLKCCGLNSYIDWFDRDWYDSIQDYEFDPLQNDQYSSLNSEVKKVSDSVPLSCCKSGSCVSNYLLELGTGSINTRGCKGLLKYMVKITLFMYLILFCTVIVVEVLMLYFTRPKKCCKSKSASKKPKNVCSARVEHIMGVKNNFSASSASLLLNPEDSDEFERAELSVSKLSHNRYPRMEFREFIKIDDEDLESPN